MTRIPVREDLKKLLPASWDKIESQSRKRAGLYFSAVAVDCDATATTEKMPTR
jgi:hypothetical protein